MAIDPKHLRRVAASMQKLAEDDDQFARTTPGKKNVNPIRLEDGTPNPETDQGRNMIIKDTELAVGDLYMRAGILRKLALKATDVSSRDEFREQLLLLVEATQKLNTHDLPRLKDSLFESLSLYGKARGQETTRQQFDKIINQKAASVRKWARSRGA